MSTSHNDYGFYDVVLGVKETPSQMALEQGLVGRFVDAAPLEKISDGRRPGATQKISRRARARLRSR